MLTKLMIILTMIFTVSEAVYLQPPEVAQGVKLPQGKWFKQKLDHFNPTDIRKWNQRFFVNDSFHTPDGPIFLMIGGEGPASAKWMLNGTWVQYGKKFGAILVQLEHRFYGDSHPTEDMSVKNLRFLSSEQALADLAFFITKFKEERNLTSNKVIAFGGSYPGSLATWFRLKFPHIVHGSVASSAPLVAHINFKEYLEVVVSSLVMKGSDECVKAVGKSFQYVKLLLEHRVGWESLTKLFNLCVPLNGLNEKDVSNLFENMAESFEDVVQYNEDNRMTGSNSHSATVTDLCGIMTNKTIGNVLERLALVNGIRLNATKKECFDHTYQSMIKEMQNITWSTETRAGGRQWTYQTCTEFGFYQTSDSIHQPFGKQFPLDFFIQQCSDIFSERFTLDLLKNGVERTNIMYGGKSPKVTRVILINGSIDPWHYLGVTKSTNPNIPVIFINGTAHCANMYPENETDSPQLKRARKQVENILKKWITEE